MSPLSFLIGFVLGAILVIAGVSKIGRDAEWRTYVASLPAPASKLLEGVPGSVMAKAEIAGGLAISFFHWVPVVTWSALAWYTTFLIVIAIEAVRGETVVCHCFGIRTEQPRALALGRGVALVCASLWLVALTGPASGVAWPEILLVNGMGTVLLVQGAVVISLVRMKSNPAVPTIPEASR